MTPEQKARLEELQAKENLSPEEAEELKTLTALPEDDGDLEPDPEAEFDAAWDETDDDGNKIEPKPDEGDTADGDSTDGDGDSEDKNKSSDKDDTGGDVLNPIPGETDSSDSGPDTTPDPKDQKIAELETKLAETDQRMRSWEGRLKAADRRAADAEAKLKEKEESKGKGKSDDVSLDEDDPELSEFFNEFPDLKGPMMKVAEKIAGMIVDKKLGKVDQIEKRFNTVQDTLQEDADAKHQAAIEKAHPDYLDIYNSGALTKWIKLQPAYLQPRLNEIVTSGNTQEVIDMYNSYKRAAGKNKPNPKPNASDLSEEKKKRAKAMQAVPASSGGPIKPKALPPKDDFDAAWKHFSEEEEKKKR